MATDASVSLDFEDEVTPELDSMKGRLFAAVKMLASTEATKLQGYMQRKRPWTDRTGEAKRRLSATVSTPNDHLVRITLSHGVDYGKWLELAHEGKYAIIKPTIKKQGPGVYKRFHGFLDELK